MKNEKITIFNENLLKSLDIQRQCAMEEFVRKMREERMCQIYNNDKRTVGKKDNKMEELKKCPFCGGNASKVFDPDGTEQPDGKKWAYTVVWVVVVRVLVFVGRRNNQLEHGMIG